MAYYHLRIKSDTKPDGKKVLAAVKVDYVHREGPYKDIDKRRMQSHNIFQETISSKHLVENPPVKDEMIYESPFGSIMREHKTGALKISKDASIETVAIALSLAEKLFDGDLTIKGSKKFKSRCQYTSADLDLKINFHDKSISENIKKLKEEKNYERRNQVGGIPRRSRERQLARRKARRRRSSPFLSVRNITERSGKIFTAEGKRLPHMSECDVVVRGEGTEMLVQGDERLHLHNEGQIDRSSLRWSLASGRRIRISRAVDEIIRSIENNSDRVYASSHLQYINREAAFQKRGGCIETGHHLPSWAEDNPKKFFDAADMYSPENDERYKEIEFALPNELTTEEHKKIINTFIEHHLSNHYYAWAIHDKVGTMDNVQNHPHVHIMFSTKENDEVEKNQERPPELYFKKYNFRYPDRGGPKKAEKWIGKERNKYLNEVREDYAKIQNDALRDAGIPLRVDHRTKKVQHKEALDQGYTTLAKLLELYPEKYIDTMDMLNQDSEDYQEKKKYRDYKDEYIRKLQAADHLERLIEEEKNRDTVDSARKNLREILADENPEDNSIEEIKKLKLELITLLNQEVDLSRAVLKENDALRDAQTALMNKEEKEKFSAYWILKEEKRSWLNFKSKLKKPPSYQTEETLIYEKLIDEMNSAITDLNEKITKAEQNQVLKDALVRLSSSAIEKKVMSIKLNLLNSNKPIRDKYYALCNEINSRMTELQNLLDDRLEKSRQESYEKTYTGDDVLKALYAERKRMVYRLNKLEKAQAKQEKNVFSLERSEEIAKNIYVNGAYKTLREDIRNLQKQETYYENDLRKLEELRSSGGDIKTIQEEEHRLATVRIELDQIKVRLNETKQDLDKRCAEPKALDKITAIQKGILAKNQPEKTRRDYLAKKVTECKNRIKELDEKINELKKLLPRRSSKEIYRVGPPQDVPNIPIPPQSATSLISEALLGDQISASFVYVGKPRKEDWQCDWFWMSEMDRDAARNRLGEDRY